LLYRAAIEAAASTTEAGGRSALGRTDGMGWRTGATWLLPMQGVRLHASASERKRFPALRELYAGALNRFVPNPTLRPETAHSAELGVSVLRGRVDAQAVVFSQRIDDAVVRVTLPDSRFRRVNRDRFTSRGVELTAGAVWAGTSVRGDVTVQRARIVDATIIDPTLRRPEDVPDLFGSITAMTRLPRAVEGTVRLRMLGATRCSNPVSGGLVRQRGGASLDAGADRRWSASRLLGALTASLQVENVLDHALYDKCGLPQAGRTLRLGLRFG
jgi:iron complex outermembrane receptor protein